MTTYRAKFIGRKVGAIGIAYPITATTEGDTPEAARLALYDRFDTIRNLRLIPITEPGRHEQGNNHD